MMRANRIFRNSVLTFGLAALGGCDLFRWASNIDDCAGNMGSQLWGDHLMAQALCAEDPVREGAFLYPAEANQTHRRLDVMCGLTGGQHRLFLVSEGPLKDQELPFAPSRTKTERGPFGASTTTTQSGCTLENRLVICSSTADGGWDIQGLEADLRVTDDGRNPGDRVDITVSNFRWSDSTMPGEGPMVPAPDGGTGMQPMGEQRLNFLIQEVSLDGGVQGNP